MNSNFYEKLIPLENKEKRELLNKMSKLLDESINDFIKLRERNTNEISNINKSINELLKKPKNNNNNNNDFISYNSFLASID